MAYSWKKRVLVWAVVLAAVGGAVYLFHPRNWTYYTDGISVRQAAGDADVRLVLWENPTPLEQVINDLPNNIEPVISADGRMMIFARGKAKENVDLFMAEWNGREWSDPLPLENVNSLSDELGPELTEDGRLLYFYSDRPGGEGAYDIWVSPWSGSYWDVPVHLGAAVNSPFNEYDPAVTPGDDRLFFSSNRPLAEEDVEAKRAAWKATLRELVVQKDYDIFSAVVMAREGEDEDKPEDWSPEYNRGIVPVYTNAERVAALNTDADEGQVDFTRRGDFVYFSSNRKGGKGGFDIYRSRIFDGTFHSLELVGQPVSTLSDDMDPTLWLEGHSLVFSSNRDSDSGQDFALYQTVSREVIAKFENRKLALFWEWLKLNIGWILLFLVTLLALLWLLRLFMSQERRGALSLQAKCLFGSVLAHVLILFLLSLWILATVLVESTKGPMRVEVNDAALAREKMSLDLREEITELKATQSDMPMPQRVERTVMPEFVPAEQVVEVQLPRPNPHEFVIDYEPPMETRMETDKPPEPEPTYDLPVLELSAVRQALEMPRKEAVDSKEKPVTIENKLAHRKMEQDLTREAKPIEAKTTQVPTMQVQPMDVEIQSVVKHAPVPAEHLPDMPWRDLLPTLEAESKTEALETPDVKPVETVVEKMAATKSVHLQKVQQTVQDVKTAQVKSAEPDIRMPELKPELITAEPMALVSIETEQLPELKIPDMLPSLEVELDSSALETPDVKPDEGPDVQIAIQNNLSVQKQKESMPELNMRKQPVDQPEIIMPPSPVMAKVATTPPELAAPAIQQVLPEIALVEALPVLETLEQAESLETPNVRPVPSPPEKTNTTRRVLQAVKQEVETPPMEARSVVASVDVLITQLVAEAVMRMESPLAQAKFEASVDSFLPPAPELKELPMHVESAMETAYPKPKPPPAGEAIMAKPVPDLARRLPVRDQARAPRHIRAQLASAVLPSRNPLAGTTLSVVADVPALIDLPEDRNEIRTTLPDLSLGANIALESKPLTRMSYILRDPSMRERLIEKLGGNDETEAAISRALEYFVRMQEPDGHWDIKKHGGEAGHEASATGLALLCFMGHGHTHKKEGPYQDNIRRAVDWLKALQKVNGKFTAKDMYDQGIATIALAECYGLTKDPDLKEVVEKAMGYITRAQNQVTGGWRYQPHDKGDTSVFGWEVMALTSAEMAGLEVPELAFDISSRYLDRVGGGKHGGLYGYQHKSPQVAMVAEGMFCRQLLKHPPHDAKMEESASYLKTHLPKANQKNFYYWYYGCLSLYQHQGPIWEEWNERMREILIKSQELRGRQSGSWNPHGDSHANRMGRVVSTAMATLSLEVYYRYLPMYGGLERVGE